jgi:DNA polymerase-3 subunit alpha
MIYCPLHNHSEYSALDGLSTPKEIAERAVELGCPCCGLTDHGSVAGHLEFAKALAPHGIKPIFGAELYHGIKPKGFKGWNRNERDQAHFVVGAMTSEGLKNLWRLIDASSANFRYVGRVTWEDIRQFNSGLFATSACIQGLVPKGVHLDDLGALDKYLEIFGERFLMELHTYPGPDQEAMNLALVQIAQERGIPLVYANDAHYAHPSQYPAHDAYVAMQTGQSVDTPLSERKMWHPFALYMQEESEIRDALHYLPSSVVDEALRNSADIADKCDVQLPEIRRHLPIFVPKDCEFVKDASVSPATLFIDLVEEGIGRRYPDADASVWERAKRELTVFLDAGLEHYFLQTWDFCEFCDQNGIIRGPGRGSAAGSIVAYALGITDVDPLHYGLIFERFYNAGREKGFPDIDNDFPVESRRKVKNYLAKRWGADKVRSIGNVVRMKPKGALDKTYAAMGVTWAEKEEVKKIVTTVPDIEILGSDSIGWSDDGGGKTIYVMNHVQDEISRYVEQQPPARQPVLTRWLDFVAVVCSRVSGYGVHASGVVVSDTPLAAELPCMWSANQETQATQFPMADVDKRMFIKQDLLGLRTLDTLQEWTRLVKENHGISVVWSGLEKRPMPEAMWSLLDKGLTTGIFQIEERQYVRQLTMDFRCRSTEDLSIVNALNRPGPIRSGAPSSFIRRRNGEEPVTFDHPILEPILAETYGWFLYQEQVIAFFSALGYDLEDADAVRKILGKKKPEDMLKLYRGEGEWEGRGYRDVAFPQLTPELAVVIWGRLEDFAKYSFNKSHTVAYGTIAFRTLYAKYFAPIEFLIACIRTNPEEIGQYVAEGRRMSIDVRPPDIRLSDIHIGVSDKHIYYGLSNIKGIGPATARYAKHIVSKYDVLTRSDLTEGIAQEQQAWEERRDKAKAEGLSFKELSPRQKCRSNTVDLLEEAGAFDNYESRTVALSQIQESEKNLLGVILTDTSQEALDANADLVAECDSYLALQDEDVEYTHLPGTIIAIRKTKTKNTGVEMGFVKIEYEADTVEFVVFPQQWTGYKFLWRERTPGIFKIRKTDRGYNFESGEKLGA